MDGVLTIKGFKFNTDMYLNLQPKTIITGDSYTVHELFNMLEQYFNRKNFSDHYLQAGLNLIFEGRTLPAGEYLVFRMRPLIDLTEELRIGKKTLLGQIINNALNVQENSLNRFVQTMSQEILAQINMLSKGYGVQFAIDCEDVFSLAKILKMQTCIQGKEILLQEQDQLHSKTTLLKMIAGLETDKKKLLLIELPEYGLKDAEVEMLFATIQQIGLDNVLIFTHDSRVIAYFTDVFNYHLATAGNLVGFDEYYNLEAMLLAVFPGLGKTQLAHEVLHCIFPCKHLQQDSNINMYVQEFLRK